MKVVGLQCRMLQTFREGILQDPKNISSLLHIRPTSAAVHNHHVIAALLFKVIRTDALERVNRFLSCKRKGHAADWAHTRCMTGSGPLCFQQQRVMAGQKTLDSALGIMQETP